MIFLQAGQNQMDLGDHFEDVEKAPGSVFIAKSPAMRSIYRKIEEIASSSTPVLILGADGTGRSTTAHEIFNKDIESHSFKKLSCHKLDKSCIDEKLFGSEFSKGLLDFDRGHTLFIKGLDCWSPILQKRFLSWLLNQSQKGPRLIFSAKEDLFEDVQSGRFSRELFGVLSQSLLALPLLSERTEGIPLFISLFNRQNDFKGRLSSKALQAMKFYPYGGNIKELSHICLQMAVSYMDKEIITEEDLAMIHKKIEKPVEGKHIKYNPHLSLEQMVNSYIQMSLNHFQSKKKSAEALGISVKTIYNKIKTGVIVCSE